MKLIIDIDDEMVCNDIKNKALEPTSETDEVIINALYNGTPVTTDGDLISRSELKKAIIKKLCIKSEEYLLASEKSIYEEIDNAPTVKPFEPAYVGAERLKARQRGYEDGYYNGMEIGKTLNPKIKQGVVKINNYELETEEIVKFYSCDILGNYQEQSGFTHIEFKDGFKGVYLCNATELLEKIEKGGAE